MTPFSRGDNSSTARGIDARPQTKHPHNSLPPTARSPVRTGDLHQWHLKGPPLQDGAALFQGQRRAEDYLRRFFTTSGHRIIGKNMGGKWPQSSKKGWDPPRFFGVRPWFFFLNGQTGGSLGRQSWDATPAHPKLLPRILGSPCVVGIEVPPVALELPHALQGQMMVSHDQINAHGGGRGSAA